MLPISVRLKPIIRFFLFLFFLLIFNLVLDSSYASPVYQDEATNENITPNDLIDNKNWNDHKDYLLEPLAKFLYANLIKISKSKSSLLDYNSSSKSEIKDFHLSQSKLLNEKGFIGIYKIKKNFDSVSALPNISVNHNENHLKYFVGNKLIKNNSEDEQSVHIKSFIKFFRSSTLNGMSVLRDSTMTKSSIEYINQKYSPVLNSCRKIHSENLTDTILDYPISFDDLFSIFENIKQENVSYVESKEIFVPYSDIRFLKSENISDLIKNEICISKTFGEVYRIANNRSENKSDNLRIIDVTNELVDIFKIYPSLVLGNQSYSYYFMGRKNLLPYYIINYDFNGSQIKMLMFEWSEFKHQNEIVPILVSIKVFDLENSEISNSQLLAFTNEVTSDCFEEFYASICPPS